VRYIEGAKELDLSERIGWSGESGVSAPSGLGGNQRGERNARRWQQLEVGGVSWSGSGAGGRLEARSNANNKNNNNNNKGGKKESEQVRIGERERDVWRKKG
jgi:hypothetical protein